MNPVGRRRTLYTLYYNIIRELTWLTVNEGCAPRSSAVPTPPPPTTGEDGHPAPCIDMVMSGAAHPLREAVSSKSSSSGVGGRGGCSDGIANRPPRFARTLAAVMRSSRLDRHNSLAVRSLASGVRMCMAASRVQYRARCRRTRIRRTVKRDRTVGGDDPRISPSPHHHHYIIVRRKYYYCLSVSRSRLAFAVHLSLLPLFHNSLPSGRTYAHARTHCTARTYSPRRVPCTCVRSPLTTAATTYLYQGRR